MKQNDRNIKIDELMILTDDKIDYTSLSEDTLKELALGDELFLATSALVQLATINKSLAAAVAGDIFSHSKGDRYLQGTAIETLFGLDKRRAIEYLLRAVPEESDSYILNAIAELVIENRSDFQSGMGGRVFRLLWSKLKHTDSIDTTGLASLLWGIEAAQQLQQDRITYGRKYVELYVDVEGEWWETNENYSEEEERKEEIIYFLESDEEVAVTVRKRLKAMWIAEIAAELEKSLRLSEAERNYAVKNLLGSGVQKTGSESKTEEIELQDLAADLLEKLDKILTELAPSSDLEAQKVRERLEKALSISEIVVHLEKCLSISEPEERLYRVKNIFAVPQAGGAIVREESVAEDEEIEILDLAEDLLEKLDEICSRTRGVNHN